MLWSIIYKEIKATPFRAGCKDLNIFKIFFIKHGSNASPQLDRGLNGTEGEAFSIQQTFNFLFFYEGFLLIIKSRDLRKIYGGGSLCHPTVPHMRDVAPNQ
jgi:hypothetical protein